MSTPFSVIRATRRQLGLIVPLFDAYRQFYQQPSDIEGARQFLAERLQRRQSVIFLAVSEGVGLGFVQLYPTFSSVAMQPVWILNDLFVAKEFRRLKVASALLERAQAHAHTTRAIGLELETATDNFPAQALYEASGWTRSTGMYRYGIGIQAEADAT